MLAITLLSFPECVAISTPLRREVFLRFKVFNYVQFSGIVEPIAGEIAAYLVLSVKALLQYALSFAAGEIIFVVVEELLPVSQTGDDSDLSTIGEITGFATRTFLDVTLG